MNFYAIKAGSKKKSYITYKRDTLGSFLLTDSLHEALFFKTRKDVKAFFDKEIYFKELYLAVKIKIEEY
jgi:hypothetical protein